jgi:hypothetical protein
MRMNLFNLPEFKTMRFFGTFTTLEVIFFYICVDEKRKIEEIIIVIEKKMIF